MSRTHYLDAAISVLRHIGKPMHYGQITDIAVKMGYLQTTARNPEIAMSTTLSAQSQASSHAQIAKVRPGVYELRRTAEYSVQRNSVDPDNTVTSLVMELVTRLRVRGPIEVHKRSLYFLRQCLELGAAHSEVLMIGDIGEKYGTIHTLANAQIALCSKIGAGVPGSVSGLNSSLTKAYSRIGDNLEHDLLSDTVITGIGLIYAALSTLEHANHVEILTEMGDKVFRIRRGE
ncbi:hypothetical protein FIL92_00575 [SAR202 cluster bacterium AD-812-D07_MRT_10900m]|nr:hypothetical protein [SAR202 cluster bacterium AD-812-D07_MRT_10900m]